MATPVQRATAVIGALADVATPAPALISKYAQAVWDVYGPMLDPNSTPPNQPILNPTNPQLATFFIRHLREHLKAVLETKRLNTVAETARTAEKTAIETEVNTELGIT